LIDTKWINPHPVIAFSSLWCTVDLDVGTAVARDYVESRRLSQKLKYRFAAIECHLGSLVSSTLKSRISVVGDLVLYEVFDFTRTVSAG
jgi:hypothetical protein